MDADQKPEKQYKLTLGGDGLKIEREIPESLALQVVSLVMGGHSAGIDISKPRFLTGQKLPIGGVQMSLREFMDASGAKRNPEKIVAIGAYFKQQLGQEVFTRKEVKLQFKNAAEAVPGNYTRDFDWAVNNGWLAPNPGAPKDYYVTKTGFVAIENKFSDEIRQTTKLKLPRRTKKRPRNKDNSQ